MKVIWSPAALSDLTEIRDHIATDNRERAISFVLEITHAGETIADMPRAYPMVPRLEHQQIRRRLHGPYLIFYRIDSKEVQILHVAHGSRDYLRTLFDEE